MTHMLPRFFGPVRRVPWPGTVALSRRRRDGLSENVQFTHKAGAVGLDVRGDHPLDVADFEPVPAK